MKKISKSAILNKGYRKKKYFKVWFAALICIFVIAVAALIKFYLDVNEDTSNISFSENYIISDLDTEPNDYKIFRNDDGMLGVKNADGRNIIEPEWDNIYFLNSGRFAVQKKNADNQSIGIIDSDENCVAPFIFDNIISIGKNFLAGYLVNSNEKKFALLDTRGNIISDRSWTEFEYNDKTNIVYLSSETGNYGYKYENTMLICTEVNFTRYVEKYQISYISRNAEKIEIISPEKMYDIYNNACIYLGFLLTGNINNISDITNDQSLNSLAENEFFKNCDIKKIDNLNIDLSDDNEEAYILSMEVSYNYKDESKTIENLKSLITLSFVNNDKHSAIIKSINKEEL